MNLKQLEYFVHVAELGSFTRAAEHLDIAQPALSRQVPTYSPVGLATTSRVFQLPLFWPSLPVSPVR
jgi:hypothetical protein